MAVALEFENISKCYRSPFARRTADKERWALRDFNLQIQSGEIVGFLGPNGAGKTTAIHIALGLARATAGRGRLLSENFGKVASRRKVGFLSESPAFYHQSARTTLKFCGALNGVREPELSRRTNHLLASVGLCDDAERNISKFSRGMLQRLGIAQALINEPELLILDEPTSALDPLARMQVRETLLAARNEGKTIFLSSHQLSEVELVCDRVAFIHQGRLVTTGRTRELLKSAEKCEIVAEGMKEIPFWALEATREGDGWRCVVRTAQQREAIEWLWASGANLISVTPKTRTLEELFVELMQPPRSDGKPQ